MALGVIAFFVGFWFVATRQVVVTGMFGVWPPAGELSIVDCGFSRKMRLHAFSFACCGLRIQAKSQTNSCFALEQCLFFAYLPLLAKIRHNDPQSDSSPAGGQSKNMPARSIQFD